MLEKAKEILEQVKSNRKLFLPLDLQLFADGDGDASSGDAGTGTGDDDGDGQGNDNKDGDKSTDDSSNSSKKQDKSFSQEDVNNLVAREAKKATEKLLKQLGVTDFKTAKEGLDKFKEIQDSQKTDVQKALERAKTLEDTNQGLTSQVSTLNAQLAALKADVNPDSLNDVIVLANNLVSDEKTIDDAIQDVLKKYPNFKREAQQQKQDDNKKPKFTDGKHDTMTVNKLNKISGLRHSNSIKKRGD
jgi:hypothetical protein